MNLRSERGTALMETALTLPIVLLVAVATFEFGAAYQTWQVLTNAAREGARIAVLPSSTNATASAMAQTYMTTGELPYAASATVTVNRADSMVVNGSAVAASRVTINYPFQFMVLQPVMQLVSPSTTGGGPVTITATALMRNEAQ